MMMTSMTIGVAFGDHRERQRGIGLNERAFLTLAASLGVLHPNVRASECRD
jgi:hypothetical protein